MKCRICSEYLGFNDNVLCENKSCVSLKIILEKISVRRIVEILKENIDEL